ncbi:small-conductance mechanosensitive ion channel [Variovorax sp. J22P271]|uniref:mechanosensitive ion channel family protein n=1 Tax=Variovorax davisae TaxID=3053515 RepID=UPI0025768B98|nr:small-conductance mechanosensitive ion channel [Variovorax sp. J22P271]MDM0032245.1 small-conductance mechanosensitive ion channel [Variovorax sp. J22P271]
MTAITDWSDAAMASLAGALALFFAAIPRVLGFAVIIVLGWIVASLLEKLIRGLLHAVKFEMLAREAGFAGFVQRMGMQTDSSGFLALISKWFIRLIVMVVAFDALGLPAVSSVLRQLLLWLPNLVVALVVLVIGGLLANAASSLVRGATSEAGFDNPDTLAKVASIAIWCFAIVIAVNQIGIAETLVNTLFMVVVGSAGLAAAIAFGWGGHGVAEEIVRKWYRRGEDAGPKIATAADQASSSIRSE